MSKPKVKLIRVHQINGPDYWKAKCYIQEHTLHSVGMTPAKAIEKMWEMIDRVIYRDWYDAHEWNRHYDLMNSIRESRIMREVVKEIPPVPKEWKWYHWFYNPSE